MSKRVLIILGHSVTDSLCGALADSYASGAELAGNEVRRINLGELEFDPLLRHGYSEPQEFEADLIAAQQAIEWADHLVLVYPNWWGSMPALLKGFLDRVLLPGFAFKYREDSPWSERLLTGRSADLLVTMDAPPLYYRFVTGRPGHKQMKKAILGFCGVKPIHVYSFGPVRSSGAAKRAKWISKASEIGSRS